MTLEIERRTIALAKGSDEKRIVELLKLLHFINVESEWVDIVETDTDSPVGKALLISATGVKSFWDKVATAFNLEKIQTPEGEYWM